MDDEDDAFLYGDEEGSEPVATAAAERLEDMGEGKDTFSPVFDAKALGRAQDPGVLASSLTGEKGGQAQDRARDAKTEREQDGRQEEDMDEEGSIEDEDSDSVCERPVSAGSNPFRLVLIASGVLFRTLRSLSIALAQRRRPTITDTNQSCLSNNRDCPRCRSLPPHLHPSTFPPYDRGKGLRQRL